MNRSSLTTDSYQESHLAMPFTGWSRGMYIGLALFTGYLAVMVFLSRSTIEATPVFGRIGYFFFQLMTFGVCLIGLYGALGPTPDSLAMGQRKVFSWWGFFIRSLFMGALFLPFAIMIGQIIFSGAGTGLFIDLGGWEGLTDATKPWGPRLLLAGMGLLLGAVIVGLGLIPLWFLSQSLDNLGVIMRHGSTVANFDQAHYIPGSTVKLSVESGKAKSTDAPRRVFLNFILTQAGAQPASKKGYQREYLHSEYQDLNVSEMQEGFSFTLPERVPGHHVSSAHSNSPEIRYWEILVEEPDQRYWARFLFTVQDH